MMDKDDRWNRMTALVLWRRPDHTHADLPYIEGREIKSLVKTYRKETSVKPTDMPVEQEPSSLNHLFTSILTLHSLFRPDLPLTIAPHRLTENLDLLIDLPLMIDQTLILTYGDPPPPEAPVLFAQTQCATIQELNEDEEDGQDIAILRHEEQELITEERLVRGSHDSVLQANTWEYEEHPHDMEDPKSLIMQNTSKSNCGYAPLHDAIIPRCEMSQPGSPLDELLQDPFLTEDGLPTSTKHDSLPDQTNFQSLGAWGLEDITPGETQVPQDSRVENQYESLHDFSVRQASHEQTAPLTGGPPQVSPIALIERELDNADSYQTPLRPTVPCQPLQSAYTSVSRESLSSKRIADLEDVFGSTPAPRKRRKQYIQEADDERELIEVDLEKGQWRVGKTPGHQGSHIKSTRKRSAEEDEGGREESLNQSINNNAERVLKRPFRPPKVVLAKAKPKLAPSSPDRAHHTVDSKEMNDRSIINDIGDRPFPIFRSQPLNRTSRLGKPFRPPAKNTDSSSPIKHTDVPNSSPHTASDDPSLISGAHLSKSSAPGITLSRSNYPSGHSSQNATPRQQLTALEARARKLRDALRLITDPEEDERLVSLTSQWRAAGREVVERLFALVPKPDTESTAIYKQTTVSPMFGNGVYSSPWKEIVFTPEQTECLRTAKRNADGDPVDEDGELLLGDKSDSEEELRDELRKEVERGRKKHTGEYRPSLVQSSGSWMDTSHLMTENKHHMDCSLTPAEKSMSWDYGSMMLRFGVDPHLLGWNADEEDWNEENDKL